MKITIIVPVFNGANSIVKAISSFLELSNFKGIDASLYIVDDCSDDGTLSLVEDFVSAETNIELIRNRKNIGPGMSRNAALEKISDGYIGFLDADDAIIPPNYFDSFKKGASINADWITFNGWVEQAGGFFRKYDFDRIVDDTNILIRKCMRGELDGSVIFSIYSAELIKSQRLRFPKGFYEDIPFAYSALVAAKTRFISNSYAYTKKYRPESIVHTISEKHIDGLLNACVSVKRKFTDCGLSGYNDFDSDFVYGAYGNLAHALRDILKQDIPSERRIHLLDYLFRKKREFIELRKLPVRNETKKDILTSHFIRHYGDSVEDKASLLQDLIQIERTLFGESIE